MPGHTALSGSRASLQSILSMKYIDPEDFQELIDTCILGPIRPLFMVLRLFGCSTLVNKDQRKLRVFLKLYAAVVACYLIAANIQNFCRFGPDEGLNRNTLVKVSVQASYVLAVISFGWCHFMEYKLTGLICLFRSLSFSGKRDETRCKRHAWFCVVIILGFAILMVVFVLMTNYGFVSIKLDGPWEPVEFENTSVASHVALIGYRTLGGALIIGIIWSCICLQWVTVISSYVGFRGFNESITRILKPNDVTSVMALRAEYQNLANIMDFLDNLWTYYVFFVQVGNVSLICGLLFVLSKTPTVSTKSIFSVFIVSYTLNIVLSSVPAIMANEQKDNCAQILLKSEGETLSKKPGTLHLSEGYVMNFELLLSHVSHNRICFTSGFVFKMSRAMFVTATSAITSYFVILSEFSSRY